MLRCTTGSPQEALSRICQGGRLQTLKTGTGNPVTPTLQGFEYDYDLVGNIDWIKD